MSLGEEIRTFQRREGAEEQARKDRIELIETVSNIALIIMHRDKTDIDETLNFLCVSENIKDDVRAKVLSKTS